ncbi:hypothetical protein D3C71_1589570 [compost metagenome]
MQSTTGNAPPVLPTESNAYWRLLARKGTDGSGTGDFVGPPGGVADGQVIGFDGTTGKLGKGLSAAQVRAAGDVYAKSETYTQAQTQSLVTTARQVRLGAEAAIGTTENAWNYAPAGTVVKGMFIGTGRIVNNISYRSLQQTDLSGNWVTVPQV